ncbi:MAG TPA: hypothetical protein VKU93_08665 [Terracidiphilus sp.]|jgi:DNA-binding MarR family transcriptional regulator|nr:hypothetical protein [Terracidiphilus sp.]
MTSPEMEIQRRRSSAGLEEAALLNLLRASDGFERALQRSTRAWGITATQYNVLRILRGAHPAGLACAAIGRRMIAAEPDITRLLGRLKTIRLVRQRRDRSDRRVVWTQITEAGLKLLRAMDPAIERMPKDLLGHMSAADLAELNRLLELARKGVEDRRPAKARGDRISCEGKE